MAFSFRAGTNWCHDFPKLARESGFYFNMHGSRVRVDWNRIGAIDIDRMIRERDFLTIDENINNVIDYCLENEYDVKILDSNFVKLFRLAQLSVEYLLYCKQYLDHSVIILKDELRSKIEQNVNMKKEIATSEDTIKSLKERSKEKYKLIETRLGESNGEVYKCPHCPKTFVSAMFVNAHVARRHSYCISDVRTSVSPVHEHYRAETEKLHNEIKTLKERLNQAERVIRSESDKLLDRMEKDYDRNMSGHGYDANKVDRLREQKRCQEDIGSLKNILFDEIRALREKEHTLNESILEANVKTLISQQEKEIENLRNQLLERLTPGIESMQLKLQTQENYWKAKIEDMETQHHRDIEKLTTELKVTQQAADYIKSEYVSKVHDLEKQTMDQSNMLVEQGKQLSCLSREISNSQTQYNNHRTKEKESTIEQFRESPLLKIKRDTMYSHDDNQIYHKDLNGVKNGEIVIEDVGSETSQEYEKLESFAAQSRYMSNRKDTTRNRDIKKFIIDSKIAELAVIKSDLKNSDRLETAMKMKDIAKHRDALKDESFIDKTSDRTAKILDTRDLENVSVNTTKQYMNIRNVERRTDDIRNNKRSQFLKKSSISSMTESECSSSMSQSESDSESAIVNDDVTVKKYEISSVIKSPDTRKALIQEDARNMFDNRLRDLGIDPEWQDIPTATFKQKMEIIRHQQNINAKKLVHYNRIKQKILEDVLQRISMNNKEMGNATLTKKSLLDKVATHVKSKASKALNSHKDSDQYVSAQKTENITPSKLRLKQKIELLPKKYKDEETFENTRESPLNRSKADVYTSPKTVPTQLRLFADQRRSASRDITSASSIENSPEKIKQISSKKITVSDNGAHKAGSPISRKQMVTSKFSESNDSDSIIIQRKDSVVSPRNNKSSLKLTSGSMGSLVKKKVLFDLEDGENDVTVPENDQRKSQIHDNDWNISSFPEGRDYTLQKEKSMSTGNIILKTSQSDKIAEISKKIQEQLRIVRKPPVGSVETIFRSNINLEDLTNYSTKNHLLRSTSLASSILESPVRNFASPTAKSSVLPQPAPRTLKDKDHAADQRKSELSTLKYSDLDSDIDEILQME